MRQVTPAWKILTAVLSLLLTLLVWQKGLEESFDRPSVAPKLTLRQQEMALVASPAVPQSIRPIFVGGNPEETLKETLLSVPIDQINDRERLVLALLENSQDKRGKLLLDPFLDQSLVKIQNELLSNSSVDLNSLPSFLEVNNLRKDPLLFQLTCFSFGGDDGLCLDLGASKAMALRLVAIQLFPFLSILLGVGLLIRHVWTITRKNNSPWPKLSVLPLSSVDMVLLVAGGFVVLGEVLLPAFVVPFSEYFIKGVPSPINESLKVLVGYIAMTLPPLFILYKLLQSLTGFERPEKGWLQWGLKPPLKAIFSAIRGWLMVMPFVFLTGWLINSIVGDQGGSNPLLDLVLGSHNPWALLLLLFTTVVLAPLFEELIFRGTLLPVLSKDLGRFWGVIVSSFIFALAHLSVGELPPLFVLGVGLGLLRLSSGRLFPCAIMHSLWNGVTFVNLLLLG